MHEFKRIINHYYTGRHFKHFVKSFQSDEASKEDAQPCDGFAGVDPIINTLHFAMQILSMGYLKYTTIIKCLCFKAGGALSISYYRKLLNF